MVMRCWERGREEDEGLAVRRAGSLLHSIFVGREAEMWSCSSVPGTSPRWSCHGVHPPFQPQLCWPCTLGLQGAELAES